MNRNYLVGTIGGLVITVETTAMLGTVVLYVLLTIVGVGLFSHSIGSALLFALLSALLHWLASYLHHYGHSLAARRTGHPMLGLHYHTMLARSIYPEEEGELPAKIHIQRALGGPIFSAIMTIVGLILVLLNGDGVLRDALMFFTFDSFFVYTIGALTPLGFTDGSTILYYRNKV